MTRDEVLIRPANAADVSREALIAAEGQAGHLLPLALLWPLLCPEHSSNCVIDNGGASFPSSSSRSRSTCEYLRLCLVRNESSHTSQYQRSSLQGPSIAALSVLIPYSCVNRYYSRSGRSAPEVGPLVSIVMERLRSHCLGRMPSTAFIKEDRRGHRLSG